MRSLNLLYAFIGGAIVGAGAALLFAPERGDELRAQIRELLAKYGICTGKKEEEIEEIIDEIAEEIKKS